ncbi:hypothetical protein [Pseudaestuariivita atlantica]|uniref:hypothetical protein n=1 Tax=Pseudaestuariivita atlantica TaxID=1317121 RepID=UPI001069AD63|nr:hypothetical protein [Pseudaestuariivita atlantica]
MEFFCTSSLESNMKKFSIAAAIAAVAAVPAAAQQASTDPFVATQGIADPLYIALGIAFLAIAVAASSGTD